MAVGERERRELQEALVDAIGSDSTDTLMHYLPPVGWADVATKHDLRTLETTLRSEMAGTEDRLRREVEACEHRLHGEIAGLRGELAGLRGDLHHELRTQFYWTATLVGILLTAFVAAIEIL